jgi:hypothetical protein
MKDQEAIKIQPTSHRIKKRKHPFIGEAISFLASMLMLARFVDGIKSCLIQPNFTAIIKTAIFFCLTALGIFTTGFFSYQRYKLIGRVRKEIKIYEKLLNVANRKQTVDEQNVKRKT